MTRRSKPRDRRTMRRARLGGPEIGRALTRECWTPPWRKWFTSEIERDTFEQMLKIETGFEHVYPEQVLFYDEQEDRQVIAEGIRAAKRWEADQARAELDARIAELKAAAAGQTAAAALEAFEAEAAGKHRYVYDGDAPAWMKDIARKAASELDIPTPWVRLIRPARLTEKADATYDHTIWGFAQWGDMVAVLDGLTRHEATEVIAHEVMHCAQVRADREPDEGEADAYGRRFADSLSQAAA